MRRRSFSPPSSPSKTKMPAIITLSDSSKLSTRNRNRTEQFESHTICHLVSKVNPTAIIISILCSQRFDSQDVSTLSLGNTAISRGPFMKRTKSKTPESVCVVLLAPRALCMYMKFDGRRGARLTRGMAKRAMCGVRRLTAKVCSGPSSTSDYRRKGPYTFRAKNIIISAACRYPSFSVLYSLYLPLPPIPLLLPFRPPSPHRRRRRGVALKTKDGGYQ